MLLNSTIIPIKDQKMDTEAIMVSIVKTEIVIFQISLNSSQTQIQKTMMNGGRKQICWTSQEKLPVALICKSIYHWTNTCPNKVKDALEDVNITLFTQEMYECYLTKLVGETFNCAVLERGCTKSVRGESWSSNYIDTLTEMNCSQMSKRESAASFRFGDQNSVMSGKTDIPFRDW